MECSAVNTSDSARFAPTTASEATPTPPPATRHLPHCPASHCCHFAPPALPPRCPIFTNLTRAPPCRSQAYQYTATLTCWHAVRVSEPLNPDLTCTCIAAVTQWHRNQSSGACVGHSRERTTTACIGGAAERARRCRGLKSNRCPPSPSRRLWLFPHLLMQHVRGRARPEARPAPSSIYALAAGELCGAAGRVHGRG